ncbi:M1 family metallopeptidase [Gulosibacter bifidus]|uniref:Aminopeptidase N n=1 Tax=Gulosibacter bifidus TaxID=272239 RepID=A0ABW5RG61_9MICO|nr:M1 family aminopeptidase [Gulosibacter bifidus]
MSNITVRRAWRNAFAAVAVCSLPLGIATTAYAAPLDGAPSIGDTLFAGIGNTGYDVQHYDVDMAYFHEAEAGHEAGSIAATATISARADHELGAFSLDFEGMQVDSVLVNGAPAKFSRSEDKAIESFKLHITPATPVHGDFTIEVQYSGVPVEHIDNDGSSEGWVATADGTTALGQPVGAMAWIPCNNTPADKATFDFEVTIPNEIGGKPAAVAGNGNLVDQVASDDGTRTTWHWRQENQQATMVTMLSIGNFIVREGSITLSDGTEIPEWSFWDASSTDAEIAEMDHRRGQVEEMTTTLESLYGPYPGMSTGIVVDKNPVGYALETQDRSFFPGKIKESTLVHEIAHQWYGDAVSPSDWGSIWISEGQGTYAPLYWTEKNGGKTTAEVLYAEWDATAADDEKWSIAPGAMTDQVDLYGWHSYNRAAMMYEALRQVLGDDVFHKVIRGYVQDHLGESLNGAEFIAYAEEVSGKDLTEFFDEWIYQPGKPAWPSTYDYNLDSEATNQRGASIRRGSVVTYTLDAANTGQVALADGTITVDLSDVLDNATIDAASLPEGLSLDGDTLVWSVPEVDDTDTASVSFTVTVDADAPNGAKLRAVTEGSLGGFCAEGATCNDNLVVAGKK